MLTNQADKFELDSDVTYLNCAYMSPAMKQVSQAGAQAMRLKAKPWLVSPEHFFQQANQLRIQFAQILGCDAKHIFLTPSVSYGMATAAQNIALDPGQKILVLAEQFPSNYYAWQKKAKRENRTIDVVQRPADSDWTAAILAKLDSSVGLLCLAPCHWTDGSFIDLDIIGPAAKKLQCRIVIDGTQSVGAMPIDFRGLDADFVICAAYKWLLGPYGLALGYAKADYFNGEPLEDNWINKQGSENFSGLVNYRDEYQPGAQRFDMGGKSFWDLAMSLVALQQINQWGVENIAERLKSLTDHLAAGAEKVGAQVLAEKYRVPHMLGLKFGDRDLVAVSESLKSKNIFVSVRGDAIRVSPHLYNTEEHVEKLLAALA